MQVYGEIGLGEFVGVAVAVIDFEDGVAWLGQPEDRGQAGDIARERPQIDVGSAEELAAELVRIFLDSSDIAVALVVPVVEVYADIVAVAALQVLAEQAFD